MMDYLPIFLDLKGKKTVVTGGGTVAARRAERALNAGACVHVFSITLCADFDDLKKSRDLVHYERNFKSEDIEGAILVWGCMDDDSNQELAELARRKNILVNIADVVENCDFIMPSIVDRNPLVIAISTEGASPILARAIRARLEVMLPDSYGNMVRFIGGFRNRVMDKLKTTRERLRFWEKASLGPAANMFLAGDKERATRQLEDALEKAARGEGQPKTGEVYLVGAGPGDPDLLTFRALRLMQLADVVVHDRLIGDGIINLTRHDAERVYVGKISGYHIAPQEKISQMLVQLAKQGKRVLRLKGGDPFIFGRGGEEIEILAKENIPFQVVPGITSASACATYAGIPLTHRDHAHSCFFITGHGRDRELDIDWKAALHSRQTVAIYMGLGNLEYLCKGFIEHGADPDLPVAVVENGTRPNQKVVVATLSTLFDMLKGQNLQGPAMIIVGTVVNLRKKLSWYQVHANSMHSVYISGEMQGWLSEDS